MKKSLLNKTRRLCLYAVIPVLLAAASGFGQTIENDILKLLKISGTTDVVSQLTGTMIQQFRTMFPAVPSAFWDEFVKKISDDEFLKLYIPIYKKYYTHNEIRELIKFFESPVGRKMAQVTPAMAQDAMLIGQKWGERIGADIIRELQAAGF
jgi:hypothetical protein